MTCIVGFVDDSGVVHIASDSLGSDGHTKSVYGSKVFRNGEFIIGYTSSFRMGQILKHVVEITKNYENLDDEAYMVKIVIPQFIKSFTKEGFASKENEVVNGGVFLIGYKSSLFLVQDDFSILKPKDCMLSVGSGEDYALSCLQTLIKFNDKLNLSPREICKLSINSASRNITTVGGEIYYINSEMDESEKLED